MKKLFPGYYRPTAEEFGKLWQNAIFVLDANVLLNLYRYPEKARDDLLAAFSKIKDRLWVPYQAALEYQRNRQSVVADQRSRFRDVRDILDSVKGSTEKDIQQLQLTKRHANINPEKFVESLTKLVGEFTSELDELERAHANEVEKDALRIQIESLLDGNVGPRPSNQTVIDTYYKDGDIRFAKNIPPGYLDRKKEKDKQGDDYSYGGIQYKRKFGDLVVWKQLLEHAKTENLKDVIFVTDDDKEDWWWTIDSQGRRKLGPRPELVEEFNRETGGERFYMYSSEHFLEFANTYLNVQVNKDSIAQVTKSKEDARRHVTHNPNTKSQGYIVEAAVAQWLSEQYPNNLISTNERNFPDFIVTLEDGRRLGVGVLTARGQLGMLPSRLDQVFRGHYEIAMGNLYKCLFVIVLIDDADEQRVIRSLRYRLHEIPAEIEIRLGRLIDTDNGARFQPSNWLNTSLELGLENNS